MRHNRTIRIIALLVLCELSIAEAQLFKGRANRQSGGSSFNNGSMQQQSRGGLFAKGRERREARQAESSSQPQTKTGLFGREKEPRQGLFGNRQNQKSSGEKQGGLFARARERKEAQQSYNANNRNYSSNHFSGPSQSNSSFVRSTQKVTSASDLFSKPTTPSPVTSASASAAPASSSSVSLARVESQPQRPELPALVSAVTDSKREPPKSVAKATRNAPRVVKRPPPKSQRIVIQGSKLKEAAPAKPDVAPTGNLPKSGSPKVEVAAAVLA